MIRICSSLQANGYDVTLVGRVRKKSKDLIPKSFNQKRLFCFFDKGKMFYIEYNIRLFFYLLFVKTDLYCAIDLDSILPNLFASKIRRKKRVYDAHELFCEMDEIVSRPMIYKVWKSIENYAVPQFRHGYTIGDYYAQAFRDMYGVQYEIIRNATILAEIPAKKTSAEKYILYQGAVNEGRCFETLIPAMKNVDCKLIVCGAGNFFEQAKALIAQYHLEEKIELKGYIEPNQLKEYTLNASIGITLFSNQGNSNYLSMANRFFDYMHFAIPQLCVNFPEYRKVNNQYEIAVLIDNTDSETISVQLNRLLSDTDFYNRLHLNCFDARKEYCWQNEEKKLIHFYKNLS
ncbi:MAG: glycosyltransferase [Chitinophagaceae bacterium]|nr:glycosyltransferase [Chitinophagaceae bacterium]